MGGIYSSSEKRGAIALSVLAFTVIGIMALLKFCASPRSESGQFKVETTITDTVTTQKHYEGKKSGRKKNRHKSKKPKTHRDITPRSPLDEPVKSI